eukprot:7295010-Pyramimonas_sp.AAC.1
MVRGLPSPLGHCFSEDLQGPQGSSLGVTVAGCPSGPFTGARVRQFPLAPSAGLHGLGRAR